jgi:hypothetical protein
MKTAQGAEDSGPFKNMRNLRMKEALQSGECIDVSRFEKTADGDFIFPLFFFQDKIEKDYCDAATEDWVRSIGKHKMSGQILASTTNKFYENDEYYCLWLR